MRAGEAQRLSGFGLLVLRLTNIEIDFLMPQKTHSRWHAVRNSLPDGVSFELYRGLVP